MCILQGESDRENHNRVIESRVIMSHTCNDLQITRMCCQGRFIRIKRVSTVTWINLTVQHTVASVASFYDKYNIHNHLRGVLAHRELTPQLSPVGQATVRAGRSAVSRGWWLLLVVVEELTRARCNRLRDTKPAPRGFECTTRVCGEIGGNYGHVVHVGLM